MSATLNHDEVVTAICLFEAIVEDRNDTVSPWAIFQDAYGVNHIRYSCAAIAPTVEAIWNALPLDIRDVMQFDWEFVPEILDHFDWVDAVPTLRGTVEEVAKLVEVAHG